MTARPDLDHALQALREATAHELPPPATDTRIATAIARAQQAAHRKPGANRHWLAWPLALAASIALLSFIVRSVPPDAVTGTASVAAMGAQDFMPVVPLSDIESAGMAMVVPARLPRMTLAQLGFPVNPARAAEDIDTELLVNRDGSVLAVRIVY